MSEIRLLSYLAPSLPEGLFEAVAAQIAEATGLPTSLRFETRTSAPPRGEVDPFRSGEADIGFLCSPGYVWLTEFQPPAVTLLAAPVFDDPRAEGRPVYFSEVVVPSSSPATRFEDLRGGTWAFNDPCSWSGYLNLLHRLRDAGRAPFFRALRASGSHIQSVRLVAAGEVQGAAVDSNALALLLEREPDLEEWELAAARHEMTGNFVESGRLHPSASAPAPDRTAAQLYGDAWEWTASAYRPYPGYTPFPGALGEYNGKFMSGRMVLRGGSCASPAAHIRPTYRNFFPPEARWQFSGMRLARDAGSGTGPHHAR